MDRDIAGGLENIPVAEEIVQHHWDSIGSEFNKAKFTNYANKTRYDYAPKLEDDMVDALDNLKLTEKTMKKEYKPEWNNWKFEEIKPHPNWW